MRFPQFEEQVKDRERLRTALDRWPPRDTPGNGDMTQSRSRTGQVTRWLSVVTGEGWGGQPWPDSKGRHRGCSRHAVPTWLPSVRADLVRPAPPPGRRRA